MYLSVSVNVSSTITGTFFMGFSLVNSAVLFSPAHKKKTAVRSETSTGTPHSLDQSRGPQPLDLCPVNQPNKRGRRYYRTEALFIADMENSLVPAAINNNRSDIYNDTKIFRENQCGKLRQS